MRPTATPSLLDGLADAVGFVGGALAGFWLGQSLDLDIFAPGYSTRTVVGIVLVSVGGGLGLQAARRWQKSRRNKPSQD